MPLYTFTSPEGEEYEVEGPQGSSREQAFGVLQQGIKSGYYKPKAKKGFTPGIIPGSENYLKELEANRATYVPKEGPEQLKDIIKGAGETALSLGTGMYAGVQAPIAAGMKRALGMVPDWEKETARLMQENTYAPRTEKGQEYTGAAGEVVNRYLAPFGLSGPRALAGLPDLVSRAKLKASKEVSVPPVVTPNREAIIRGQQPISKTKGLSVDQVPEETRLANLADSVLGKQGSKLLDRRTSYAAANFDGAYRTLVGKWYGEGKDRQFKIDTVVNGNNYWELKQGLAWAKENIPGAEFLELPRRGLNTEPVRKFKGVQQDSMSRLLSELAGMDPKFAEAKAAVDAHIQTQTKKLYGHDKHALEKKGVRGAIGNRPWLDAKRNAEDFFKQEVNHIEEGLQYWNYQDAVNETRQMAARPELAHMKNTLVHLDKYLQNISGQGLNPIGVAINSIVDTAFAATGFGSATTSKGVFNAAREAASLWMMGMFNTTFPAIQLSQFLTGMTPEAVRIRSEFGLNPLKIATSLSNSTFTLAMLAAADLTNKPMDAFPSHLVDAYKWAKEHGITQYNEVEQSHSATQNPKWSAVKDVAGLPISVPERITGPQTFMWAVDMLHDAGLRGDDLHRAAYNSSKYAMTEYHPDEAPLVYQRLGVAGPNVGGLKKFVHNSIDQQVSRYGEAFKHPAAASTLIGMTLLTGGVTGLMGTAMLDKASLALTDKGLRDHWDDVMGKSVVSQGMRDGFTSALTGFDVQSRYSLADVIPGSFLEAAAGPHLSMLAKTAIAIHEYAKHPNEQSFREAAKAVTPSGMKGMLEEGYMLGDQGQVLDKNAMNKYPPEMNRTEIEHKVRQWGGPKPLRERLYDEQKYQADVVQRRIEKKRGEATTRMTASMGFKDPEGFKKAMTDFINAEGDVSTLDKTIQNYYEQQMLSSKQRAGGLEPKSTIPSVKKWERYQDK